MQAAHAPHGGVLPLLRRLCAVHGQLPDVEAAGYGLPGAGHRVLVANVHAPHLHAQIGEHIGDVERVRHAVGDADPEGGLRTRVALQAGAEGVGPGQLAARH